jgi:uncharacterized integral membrane protein
MSAPSTKTPSKDRLSQLERRDKRELARAGGSLVLAGIFIAFALLNLKDVRVDWIVGSGHAPLIIVIAISLLVGIVLTYFVDRLRQRRHR